MAVAVEMDFNGATLEQYNEVMKLMSSISAGVAGTICRQHTRPGVAGTFDRRTAIGDDLERR